jgi:predicted AAA+ superfamily ATPase
MVGRFLPSYRRRPKRRVVSSAKFYFSDIGIVNHLAKRGYIESGSELYGKAFENWVFHELNAFNTYKERFADLFYWQLSSGIEVDFIVNHIDLAIEVKSSKNIKSTHLKGLRQLLIDHPETKRCIVVSGEAKSRRTDDGIDILSTDDFIDQLWAGQLF